MVSKAVNILTALIALALVGMFTLGLAYSVSTGFAGFMGWGGGVIIAIIIGIVLLCFSYDVFDTAVRKNK